MAGQGRAELEPRDVVSRAVWRHLGSGHKVYLDTRAAFGAELPRRFPGIAASCRAAGIDPVTAPMPIRPATHYHMGGVAVDAKGRTSLPGLWACGETASTGLHGANRLASNSMLEAAATGIEVARDLAGRSFPLHELPLAARTINPYALYEAHLAGGRIFLQLWHVGRISHPSLQPGGALPVAPSAIKPEGMAMTETGLQPFVTPRALDTAELPGLVEAYRQAAVNAKEAGFDGVEIHAANGYLLDQFLRDGTNKRDDSYGGPVENRARLLLEVVEVVSRAFGAGRVGVRLSPAGAFNDMADSDPAATFGFVAEQLGRRGLAYLHVFEAGPFDYAALKQAFGGLYIANGGYDRIRAAVALSTGRADLVAFGVPFIANPDLVERLQTGAELAEADRATFYGGDHRGYTDYPALA